MRTKEHCVFESIAVFKEAFGQWRRNAFAVIAIYSLTIFLTYALKIYSIAARGFYLRMGEWAASGLSTVLYAAVFFLNSFLCLVVVHYFLHAGGKRVFFNAAFNGARGTICFYFKSLLVYIGIVLALAGLGFLLFAIGRTHFGPHAAGGTNMPFLLVTSTATVVLWITSAWYGFFFSLAPLISAFEGRGVRAALEMSKGRIKHYPWRYLAVFLIFLSLYFLAGVLMYMIAASFSGKDFLSWIDPVMMAVWMPLWLGIWVCSYRRLGENEEKIS